MTQEAHRASHADRALAGWFRIVMAAPRRVLAVLFVLTVAAAGLVVARLGVDTDSSRMLAPDLPFQARNEVLNEAFPELKNAVLVVVRSEIADAADAAGAALARRLEARPELAGVFAPFADPEMVSRGLLYLGRDELDARLTRLSKASNLIAALRADRTLQGFLNAIGEAVTLAQGAGIDSADLDAVLAEAAAVIEARLDGAPRPFAWEGALAGGDAGSALRVISVTPKLDFAALNPARATLAAVREEIAALEPGLAALVEVGITGDPVLRQEELRSVTTNLGISLALSMALVAVLLWACFRSWARAGLLLAALGVTLILSAGFAAVTVGALNLISVAFVVLLIGLGIDFAIHLMAHLEQEVRGGTPPEPAMIIVGRHLGKVFAIAAGSTALAFFAFTITDFVGMAQLGLIGGAGVLIALAVTLTLVPAAVALRPAVLEVRERPLRVRRGGGVMRKVTVALVVLVAGAAALLAPQIRFDADPMALRSSASPSVIAFGWLAEGERTAPYRLSLLVPDAETAADAAARADALPEVDRATTAADLVPGDQDAKLMLIDLAWPSLDYAVNGPPLDLTEGEVTPESLAARLDAEAGPGAAALARALRRLEAPDAARDAALAGDIFRFFPQMLERLALQLEVAPFGLGDLPAPFRDRFVAGDGRQRVDITPTADLRDTEALLDFAAAVEAVLPEAAGGPVQIAGAAHTVSGAMLTATLLALAATAIVALIAIGRVVPVLAILIPVIVAGLITAGTAVSAGLAFNYANVIVLPLLIGYGVDTGVHIALTASGDPEEGRAARRAVVFSALTTAAAFGTMAFSAHPGTSSMGTLLCIALAAAMLCGLALTRPLVRLFDRGHG